MKTINKTNYGYENMNSKDSLQLTEIRERYCLNEFFNKLNERVSYNKFQIQESSTNSKCHYDAILKIYDKKGNQKEHYIIEVKVREESFQDYFLEKTKKENLLKAKEEQDIFLKQRKLNFDCGILYINFTYTSTLIWDVLHLNDLGLLKRGQRLEMNKKTYVNRIDKKLKSVYKLLINDGDFYTDYIYNKNKFLNYYNELKNPTKIKESRWANMKGLFEE